MCAEFSILVRLTLVQIDGFGEDNLARSGSRDCGLFRLAGRALVGMTVDRRGLDNGSRCRVASRLNLNLLTDAIAISAPHVTVQVLFLAFGDFLDSPWVGLVFCNVQFIIVGFRLALLLDRAPPVALASGSLDEALATSIALPGRADHIDSHAARDESGSFHVLPLFLPLLIIIMRLKFKILYLLCL